MQINDKYQGRNAVKGKMTQRINETKNQLLEKISKFHKLISKLSRKKRERTRQEKLNYTNKIQMVCRTYIEKLYSNKL